MSMTSCSDFLEAENKSAGGDDKTYLSTDEGAASLRTYCYSLLKNIDTNIDINEDGTDLYTTGRGGSPSEFQVYNSLSATNGTIQSLYTNCYKLINISNQLLHPDYAAGKYDNDAKFLRALGYYKLTQHFGSVPYITEYINTAKRNYPRTPLSEIYPAMIKDLEEVVANTTEDITYDGTVNKRAARALLAKVCLAAGWALETEVTNLEKGQYQYKPTDSKYFEKAADVASKLADETPLVNSFEKKWSQALDYNNPETYFSVQYLRDGWSGYNADGHALQGQYGSYYGNAATQGCKQSSSKNYPTTKALYLWDVEDLRYDATFMNVIYQPGVVDGKPSTDWPNNGYYVAYDATKASKCKVAWIYGNANMSEAEFEAKIASLKGQIALNADEKKALNVPSAYLMGSIATVYSFKDDGSVASKKTSIYEQDRATSLNYIAPVRKFDDLNSTVEESKSWRPVVMLHASEMYLAAAEAYAAMGNEAKAIRYINLLRQRAGLAGLANLADYTPNYNAASQTTLLDLVLDERARETYAERTRWEDLSRTKQLVRYNVAYNPDVINADQMKGVDGQFKVLRPIPAGEISTNDGITNDDQNPGYKGLIEE